MEEHKRLLVKFRRLCGQTVVVNRGYFNPKTCVNYQEVLQNIFGTYPDEDHEICYQVLYTFIRVYPIQLGYKTLLFYKCL